MEQSLTADDDEASSGHMEIADMVKQTWLTNLGSIRKKNVLELRAAKYAILTFTRLHSTIAHTVRTIRNIIAALLYLMNIWSVPSTKYSSY